MVDVNNEEIHPVQIRPHQANHFRNIVDILGKEYGYLDVSTFGAGKTHITCGVAATFKLNMIIITPKSTINNWKKWAKYYGIHVICIMTYQSLRGQDCYELNHNLLEKVDDEYRATELFEQCVKSGLLLVFDEYHNLKNENSQLASAHAMVKSLVRLVRMGYKARVALLSATPCVEKESVTSTFKMLGIIQSDKLYSYNRSSKKYELIGIQEAIAKCNQYDPDETFSITCRPVNKTTAKTICYDLYTRVLKRFLVSSMPPPVIDSELDVKNLYALMEQEDVERLKKGLLLFKSATNYRHEVQEVDLSGVNWGDVTTSRREIDSAKVRTMCRLAINDLERDRHCKILLFCNYTRDMEYATSVMSRYGVMMMNGASSEKQRSDIIGKFQSDNDSYRVLVTNPKVGGIGIDLDDKFGGRERYVYVLPSYFFTDQFQGTGRVHREGTKSKATIRFLYSRACPYETGILHSMAKKSDVLRNMVTKDHNTIRFPGEYDELLELTTEEIKTGTKQNLEQILDQKIDKNKIIYENTKNLIKNLEKIDRNALEEDKYHSYSVFLELVEAGETEENAVKAACKLMEENVQERLNEDLKLLYLKNKNEFKTETDMIQFIEGFHM